MKIRSSSCAFLAILAAGMSGGWAAEDFYQADFQNPPYVPGELNNQENWAATPQVEIAEHPAIGSFGDKQVVVMRRTGGETEVSARQTFVSYKDVLKKPFKAEAALAIAPKTAYLNASFVVHDNGAGEPGAWVGIRGFKDEGYFLCAMNGPNWEKDWVKLDADPNQDGVQPADENTLYRFQVAVDPELKTFDVVILSAEGKELSRREGISIRQPEGIKSGGYNRISLYMGGGSKGDTAYFGPVRVWRD